MTMTPYQVYTLVLCIAVYVLLVTVFSIFLAIYVKQALRIIRGGLDDQKILKEYNQYVQRKHKGSDRLTKVMAIMMTCVVFVFFGFAIYVNVNQNCPVGDLPVLRVVQSGSMSKKIEENKYLYDYNLNDQIQTFDLIVTEKLPPMEELKLFDTVVYEVDDVLVVHRIVEIIEPNEAHPDERWFRLRGDNVHVSDRFPVKYEQMRGIYRGKRIPFVGSLVAFSQSPAGIMCIILIIFGVIVAPFVEKKILREKLKRLRFMSEGGYAQQPDGYYAMIYPMVVGYNVYYPYGESYYATPTTPTPKKSRRKKR